MDKKNYTHITVEQRIKIEALITAGHKASFIAKQLNIHRSSIYRELKRNKTKTGKYNAAFAQELSEEQKERFSHNRSFTFAMEKFIREKLSKEQWSPEQIWGYCKKIILIWLAMRVSTSLFTKIKITGGCYIRTCV